MLLQHQFPQPDHCYGFLVNSRDMTSSELRKRQEVLPGNFPAPASGPVALQLTRFEPRLYLRFARTETTCGLWDRNTLNVSYQDGFGWLRLWHLSLSRAKRISRSFLILVSNVKMNLILILMKDGPTRANNCTTCTVISAATGSPTNSDIRLGVMASHAASDE